MQKLYFILFFIAISFSLFSQNERPQLTLKMKNGDVITGLSDLSTVSFKTPYGELAFPIKDVSAITLGVTSTSVDKGEVKSNLDKVQLGSAAEAAEGFEKLIKMAEGALPLIKQYMEMPGYKKRENGDYNVESVNEILLSRHHLPKNFKVKDVLQTTGESAVEGNYDFESMALETDYGKLTIVRSKIQQITVGFTDISNANSGTYKVQGNQNISGNTNGGWLNTGILVKAGQSIKINAKGQVTLASLSNNSYSPDGGVNSSPGPKDNNPTYGCLVFKIGEGGGVQKAGDNYSGRSTVTGIVYLAIYESVFNAANTGTFVTKVNVE